MKRRHCHSGVIRSDVDRDDPPARGGCCDCELQRQNALYAGTGGVSDNNRDAGFRPAYRNRATGQVVESCFADGRPAPVHVLEGLPDDWVAARDDDGLVRATIEEVEAGFVRGSLFFTRADAARVMSEEQGPVSIGD